MANTPKVIFTKTLDKPLGQNTSLAKGNLSDEISKQKGRKGKDIIENGGASFVASLIKHRHIDEFNFFIHPILINKGMRIFDLLDHRQNLSLKSSTAYGTELLYWI